MTYNPIFEEELEREEELKTLKNSIRFRSAKQNAKDLFAKLFKFGRSHPVASLATLASLIGLSIGNRK